MTENRVNLNADDSLATILSERSSVPFQCLSELQREIETQCPMVAAERVHAVGEFGPLLLSRDI